MDYLQHYLLSVSYTHLDVYKRQSLFITNLVGIAIQFDTGINMIINSFAIPTRLGHQYLIPVIFIVTAVLEYFVFKKLIVKLNIPTLGREGSEVVSEPVLDSIVGNSDSGFEPQIQNIVAGLGGARCV